MKKLFLSLLLLGSMTSSPLWAQEEQPRTPVVRKGARTPQPKEQARPILSERARSSATRSSSLASASWLRSVYRSLDLTKPANAALYYPEVTTETRANLFALIFRLYERGELRVYEYIDGEEQLDPAHELPFRDFLERFHITFTREQRGGRETLVVQPSDIPSSEVKSYYLKEAYLFDEATSTYDRQVLALCPILSSISDYGATNMPLFWVSYTDLQPYLSERLVPLSSLNNVRRASLDDFFGLHLYEGEIVKTEDLLGRSLLQSVSSPDSLGQAQRRIEEELSTFGSSLFLPDSTLRRSAPASKSGKGTKAKGGATSVKRTTPSRGKTPKVSSPRSTATRSVRDRG